jgi:hypothetical protein
MNTTDQRLPACVVCDEEIPTWRLLQFSTVDIETGAFVHGDFPICGRCAPRCATCGAPVPTVAAKERVAELNQNAAVTVRWSFEPCGESGHERPPIETHPRDPRLPLYGPPEPPRETPGYSFLIARLTHVGIGDYVNVDGEEGVGRIRYIISSRLGGGIWVRVDYPDGRTFGKRASDVHPVADSGADEPLPIPTTVESHSDTVMQSAEARDPVAVIDRFIDRAFGDGYLSTVISEAIAEGIESLRAPDGILDPDAVRAVLDHCDLSEDLLQPVLDAGDRDECSAVIADELDGDPYLLDCAIEHLVGPVDQLGGCDSSSFAVMTAGHVTTNVVIRNDEFTTFDNGSEEGFDFYAMSGRARVADDPGFKNARLDVARLTDGLKPGVWISDADELDDELREMTDLGFDFGEAVERLDVDALVGEWAPGFAVTTGQAEAGVRDRVRALVTEIDYPRNLDEERLVWEVWKEIRPQ